MLPPIGTHVKSYKYSGEDRLFFDANIWLRIFGPQGSPDEARAQSYSTGLRRARAAGSAIHIDVLVLSEFLNRCLRFYFDQAGRPGGDFKEYRGTQEYEISVRSVSSQANTILNLCRPVESDFTRCDLSQMMTQFGQSHSDWNDTVLIELCHRRDFTLVTDDGDFIDSGLKIISANSVYLQKRADVSTAS